MEQKINISTINIDYQNGYSVSINKGSVYELHMFYNSSDALLFADDKLQEGYTVKVYFPKMLDNYNLV